jgi:pSer/pThr/pTyr-binding forkhead associated (FHA) protein
MTGRAQELNLERTTIGRVEDNTFPIAEPSVSSRHCEVLLRGNEVFVRDLNSTNGTFINNEKIAEGVLKPGQILRLGNVELRLETEAAAAPAKKPVESTMVIPRGVSLDQLEQGGRTPVFGTSGAFSKKSNTFNTLFWIGAVLVVIVIVALLIYVFYIAAPPTPRR